MKSRDREIKIRTKGKGNTIPIVSSDSIQKLMKSSLFVYLVCVQPSSKSNSSNSLQVQINNVANNSTTLLNVNSTSNEGN